MAKKKTKTKIRQELDAMYSRYIRLRDADENGMCTCISCGDIKHWKKMQNGHYASRTCYSTRWDDDNCHTQCLACNRFREGNKIWYRRKLVEMYGEDKVRKIEDKSLEDVKYTKSDYEEMLEFYTKEVVELLKRVKD